MSQNDLTDEGAEASRGSPRWVAMEPGRDVNLTQSDSRTHALKQ